MVVFVVLVCVVDVRVVIKKITKTLNCEGHINAELR